MQAKFVHLRVHTEYSIVDGVVRIKPLLKRLMELGMPAVAVTDHCNFFSLVKFYRAAISIGIKPIIGADVLIHHQSCLGVPFRMTLLVQNEVGYRTLTELLSKAYLHGQHQGNPLIQSDWLQQANDGLIALSGDRDGDLGNALIGKHELDPQQLIKQWINIFPDRYYIELQRTGNSQQAQYITQAVDLAGQYDVPVVATNNVRFLLDDDFIAHEARVCIYQGRLLDDPRRPREYDESQYLKSGNEMQALFDDIPEALENTVEIAKRCNLALILGKNFLPNFPIMDNQSIDQHLVDQSHQGLEKRLKIIRGEQATERFETQRQKYLDRLDMELKVIIQMGFPGYFLIVADFICWAKNQGIPVGPGRGSGAGSLVAYALEITDLDPIKFDLIFERFLNSERVSMPDFDIDFCMDRRDQVIDYVASKYGRDRVSQIITYGSMAARAVVRDVGRVLGHPYGLVDKLAKLIPFEIGMTLDKALKESDELRKAYRQDQDVQTLVDLAKKLEGIARNAGKHAGGVVIAPSKLTNFTPLYCEQGGDNLVTQFDKDDVEAIGLVKFDFLGLRTLTIIDWALQTINKENEKTGNPPLDINQLRFDDSKTFELLCRCATTAVFQLESRGMKDLVKRLQPDCFEDIIALVALFRPGPLQSGMVDDYISVKHGKAEVEYAHPVLEPILESTNGVILYQEQVMQIARELAGYTLGGADLLRRAMGKKKAEEMAEHRSIFEAGAQARGVDSTTANYIFDLMEKFAGYGFNKSHSAAYAQVAYQTAWLKAHYPSAFMAAVLSADMDNTDKVVTLIDECRSMGLEIKSPNINDSDYRFVIAENGVIFYGLGAIKGVGQAAIDQVINERNEQGIFQNLQNLCHRVDARKANKRVLEALIKAGALDCFDKNRAQLITDLPIALKTAQQKEKMDRVGQADLFGMELSVAEEKTYSLSPNVEAWSEEQRLSYEKATLGLYLTGHPISRYEKELPHITHGRLASLVNGAERSIVRSNIRIAGLVVDMRTRYSKFGKAMSFVTLDDRSGRIEVAVFSEVYEKYRDLLSKDNLLVVEGGLSVDDYSGNLRITAEKLFSIEQARAIFAKGLVIRWSQQTADHAEANHQNFINDLENLITPFKGGNCPIYIDYQAKSILSRIQLGNAWMVYPRDTLLQQLERYVGPDQIRMEYHRTPSGRC